MEILENNLQRNLRMNSYGGANSYFRRMYSTKPMAPAIQPKPKFQDFSKNNNFKMDFNANRTKEDHIPDEDILVDPANSKAAFTALPCRSVRIGSYKTAPKDKVIFTEKGVHLKAPDLLTGDPVSLNIRKSDVLKALYYFDRRPLSPSPSQEKKEDEKSKNEDENSKDASAKDEKAKEEDRLYVIFLLLVPTACARVRTIVNMTERSSGVWLDLGAAEESMKRITILVDKIKADDRQILTTIFEGISQELDSDQVHDLLRKTNPKIEDARKAVYGDRILANGSNGAMVITSANVNPATKYCSYPMNIKDVNPISVTAEDYSCLQDDTFLNDVIIDFYLQFLQHHELTELDRNRTHFFSTYFYSKLTKRPQKKQNKVHAVEDNPNLSMAEKRHERVKKWTKKVNIFEKDFVFVPINERSHWFLAVICYPGMVGCRRMDNDEEIDLPESQKSRLNNANAATSSAANGRRRDPPRGTPIKIGPDGKTTLMIGSTTITPLKGSTEGARKIFGVDDDDSDRDEAEAADEEMIDEPELPSSSTISFKNTAAASILAGKTNSNSNDSSKSNKDKENSSESKDEKAKSEENGEDSSKAVEGGDESGDSNENGEKANSEEKDQENSDEKKSAENQNPENEKKDSRAGSPKYNPGIKQPCILIFDSLSSTCTSRAKVAATLRDYLKCEFKAKIGGEQREFTVVTMGGSHPKVPQQPNFSDCGIFVLQYAQSFFINAIKDFTLPITSLRNWFTPETVKNKRGDIAKIIRDLAMDQNPGKKLVFPNISFIGAGYSDDEDMDELEEEEKVELSNYETDEDEE